MARLRAWCPDGKRLKACVPYVQWKTMTFIAAWRGDEITSPFVFDQPMNGNNLIARVQQCLVPTLKPGDVVILDKLRSHKGKAMRAAIRAVGARLMFRPAYSPDFNPIEQVFAKLKHLRHKAAKRTAEGSWKGIGEILNHFSLDECQRYLVNSGYASA